MRKTRLFLSCTGIFALTLFGACADDETITKGGGDATITPTEGVITEAFYKGDHYGTGTGNLWINFRSEMELEPNMGDYIGPGYILCLDFNTLLAKNADFAQLTEGTYTGSETDTHAAFTLNVADGDSYLTRYEADGASDMLNIVAGTVTVSVEQGYYRLEAELKLEDGSDYPYSFIGDLVFVNRSTEGMMSNLTEDVRITELSQGLVAYNGTTFTETSDLYIVLLAGPQYDLDTNYGNSDAVMISFNVTPGASDGIPSGTYSIIDAETADDYPVGTALSGVFNPNYGGYFGSWFYSTRNKLEASMRGGSVVVTNSGSDNYTFSILLQDGYGKKVEGSYSGKCSFEDWS